MRCIAVYMHGSGSTRVKVGRGQPNVYYRRELGGSCQDFEIQLCSWVIGLGIVALLAADVPDTIVDAPFDAASSAQQVGSSSTQSLRQTLDSPPLRYP